MSHDAIAATVRHNYENARFIAKALNEISILMKYISLLTLLFFNSILHCQILSIDSVKSYFEINGGVGSFGIFQHTDSSTIKYEYFYNGETVIQERINKNKLIYKTVYHKHSRIIKKLVVTDSIGVEIGIAKYNDTTGTPIVNYNQENGIWEPLNKNDYPNYDIQCNIKQKGDSVIKSYYGDEFFKKHIIWNIDDSNVYDGIKWSDWTQPTKTKIKSFNLFYDIKFDESKIFPRKIKISFDSIGKQDSISRGLFKLAEDSPTNFQYTLLYFFEKALKQELIKDSIQNLHFDLDEYNGLNLMLGVKVGETKEYWNDRDLFYPWKWYYPFSLKYWKSSKIKHFRPIYDIEEYYFNPWTGDFISKRKFKRDGAFIYPIEYIKEYDTNRKGSIYF